MPGCALMCTPLASIPEQLLITGPDTLVEAQSAHAADAELANAWVRRLRILVPTDEAGWLIHVVIVGERLMLELRV